MPHPKKIFISYSSANRDIVHELVLELRQLGFEVWYDQDLTGGHEWWDKILEAIRACELFLFIITPESMSSDPCRRERQYARALDKFILPLQMGTVNVYGDLAAIQIVDYRVEVANRQTVLRRALSNLPDPLPLPNPLPEPPEIPIRPIDEIAEVIDAAELPEHNQVMATFWDLTKLYRQPDQRRIAVQWLRRLRLHDDLRASTAQEIDQIIGSMNIDLTPTVASRTNITIPVVAKEQPANRTNPLIFGALMAVVALIGVGILLFVQRDGQPAQQLVVAPSATSAPTATRLPNLTPTITLTPTVIPTPRRIAQLDNRANWVRSVAFNADGSQLVTASTDGSIYVWDTAITGLVGEMRADGRSSLTAAIHPSGFTLAAGYADGSIRIWLLSNSVVLSEMAGHTTAVMSVAYNPNGDRLVSAGADGTVRVWDLNTSRQLNSFEGHTGPVLSAVYSPDGQHIASASADGTVRVWDVSSGTSEVLLGHTQSVWSVAYSPDGAALASVSDDATVRFWDVTSGVNLETLYGHVGSVYAVAFSSDGTLVASAGADRTIQIWDFATGTKLQTVISHEKAVLAVAFSPDDQYIASGSEDGTWRRWTIQGDPPAESEST